MPTITLNPVTPDSAPTIQAAVNQLAVSGGTIVLNAGIYPLSTRINIVSIANLTFKGIGAILLGMPTMTIADATGCLLGFQNSNGVIVSGISFDGNAVNRGGFAGAPQSLNLCWTNNVQVIDCSFVGAVCDDIFMWGGAGSPMPPCQNVRITGCNFSHANRNAISVVNAAYVRIDHNLFTNINSHDPQAAIDIEPNFGDPNGVTHHVMLDNNTVNNCYHGFVCWNVAAPYEIHYDSNTFNGGSYPIENQAPQSTITWNHISNSKSFPICTGSGSIAQIYSNRIYKCPAMAIGPTDILGSNIITN